MTTVLTQPSFTLASALTEAAVRVADQETLRDVAMRVDDDDALIRIAKAAPADVACLALTRISHIGSVAHARELSELVASDLPERVRVAAVRMIDPAWAGEIRQGIDSPVLAAALLAKVRADQHGDGGGLAALSAAANNVALDHLDAAGFDATLTRVLSLVAMDTEAASEACFALRYYGDRFPERANRIVGWLLSARPDLAAEIISASWVSPSHADRYVESLTSELLFEHSYLVWQVAVLRPKLGVAALSRVAAMCVETLDRTAATPPGWDDDTLRMLGGLSRIRGDEDPANVRWWAQLPAVRVSDALAVYRDDVGSDAADLLVARPDVTAEMLLPVFRTWGMNKDVWANAHTWDRICGHASTVPWAGEGFDQDFAVAACAARPGLLTAVRDEHLAVCVEAVVSTYRRSTDWLTQDVRDRICVAACDLTLGTLSSLCDLMGEQLVQAIAEAAVAGGYPPHTLPLVLRLLEGDYSPAVTLSDLCRAAAACDRDAVEAVAPCADDEPSPLGASTGGRGASMDDLAAATR